MQADKAYKYLRSACYTGVWVADTSLARSGLGRLGLYDRLREVVVWRYSGVACLAEGNKGLTIPNLFNRLNKYQS